MGIGVSIFLIAAGAILTFALNLEVSGVDLDTVGWILMAVGALGLIVSLAIWLPRRRVPPPPPEPYDDGRPPPPPY